MITKEEIRALLAQAETQKTESLAIHHQATGALIALNHVLQKLDEPEDAVEADKEEGDPQEGAEDGAETAPPSPTPQLVS